MTSMLLAEYHVSERRACSTVLLARTVYRYIDHRRDDRAVRQRMKLDFSRPGKPTDNVFIESFNGSFRDECLTAERTDPTPQSLPFNRRWLIALAVFILFQWFGQNLGRPR